MTPRLAAGIQVSALIRRAEASGGTGAVLAKGDATAGAILILCCDRGDLRLLLERVMAPDGSYRWAETGPSADGPAATEAYVSRRRRNDPDLWLVELDVAGVERFAAGIMTTG